MRAIATKDLAQLRQEQAQQQLDRDRLAYVVAYLAAKDPTFKAPKLNDNADKTGAGN